MPLFELEDAAHRKFYRIELVDNRVELHWGRIGSAGKRRTIELETTWHARRVFEEELLRRRERGYRQVFDESQPRNAEEAAQRALAKVAPLTRYPRFVFRDHKRTRLAWIEVRKATLVIATGPNETGLEIIERACSSEREAMRERDNAMTGLVRDGYELEMFGAAAPKRARSRPVLLCNPDLEAAIETNPDDEVAWLVYEDWLLQHADPRAEVVEHERALDRSNAALARGQLDKLLLGPNAAPISKLITRGTWRAGFLLDCAIGPVIESRAALIAELLARPASRFVDELTVELASLRGLTHLRGASLLRRLFVRCEDLGLPEIDAAFDPALLAPFARLTELHVQLFVHPDNARLWLDAVIASGLNKHVTTFELVTYGARHDLSATQIRTFRGGAFANASRVQLPTELITG
ncbi:MAG: WGR domain-containing protein [Kofleriaceae bacterium]